MLGTISHVFERKRAGSQLCIAQNHNPSHTPLIRVFELLFEFGGVRIQFTLTNFGRASPSQWKAP